MWYLNIFLVAGFQPKPDDQLPDAPDSICPRLQDDSRLSSPHHSLRGVVDENIFSLEQVRGEARHLCQCDASVLQAFT